MKEEIFKLNNKVGVGSVIACSADLHRDKVILEQEALKPCYEEYNDVNARLTLGVVKISEGGIRSYITTTTGDDVGADYYILTMGRSLKKVKAFHNSAARLVDPKVKLPVSGGMDAYYYLLAFMLKELGVPLDDMISINLDSGTPKDLYQRILEKTEHRDILIKTGIRILYYPEKRKPSLEYKIMRLAMDEGCAVMKGFDSHVCLYG